MSDLGASQGQNEAGQEVYIDPRGATWGFVTEDKQPTTLAKPTKDKTFDPTGENNDKFYQDSVVDRNGLIDNLGRILRNQLMVAGATKGYSPESMNNLFLSYWKGGQALSLVDKYLQDADAERKRWAKIFGGGGSTNTRIFNEDISKKQQMGSSYVNLPEGFNELGGILWGFFAQKAGFDIGSFGVSSPRRGGGRSGPTAADIRGQFDLDQLASAATNIWRGMLLDDEVDGRKFARAYVDEMVKSGGKQKIDFTEYIRKRAKATDRYASIYKNKPGSMSEEQYLTPYFQSALQRSRPGEAADIAIGGAQFGSDSATFASRLQRTDATTGSAPYINQLESRMSSLNKLFRG